MSYELNFGPEFFFAEGEPYDHNNQITTKPISVWNAVESMRILNPDEWAQLAKEVFYCEPEHLCEEIVMEKIRETNTCSNLTVPVSVWIDPGGDFKLDIYDEEKLEKMAKTNEK